jgi:hypothetical protein
MVSMRQKGSLAKHDHSIAEDDPLWKDHNHWEKISFGPTIMRLAENEKTDPESRRKNRIIIVTSALVT